MRKLKQNKQVTTLKGDCLSIVEYVELGGVWVLAHCALCPPLLTAGLLPPQGTWLCLPQMRAVGDQRFLNLSIA